MISKVSYTHFTPNKKDHQACSELMRLVDDLSPSDSNIEATVDRTEDGFYKAVITVRGFCGAFDSESSGPSLLASFKKAQRGLLDNIKDWKRQRFN